MKLHRFYIGERWERKIQHFGNDRCWVQDNELLHQWQKVLRYKEDDELTLFDGYVEVLYRITEIKNDEIALKKVTEITPKKPQKHIMLAWSLLKKDKNDWVIQKATEIGVTHFVPIESERSEKTGFNKDRATKIIIEASEQCGRIDIPVIDEPRSLGGVIKTYKDAYNLYVCNEESITNEVKIGNDTGVLVGPEGGWSEREMDLIKNEGVNFITLGNLTLRAETAALVAATKILGIAP